MKTLGKIIILLVVMLLISGGFYLGLRNVNMAGGREGFENREGGPRPEGFEGGEGRERGEGGFGIFSVLAIVPELLKVSIVAVIVYWVKKAYDATQGKRQTKATPPAAG